MVVFVWARKTSAPACRVEASPTRGLPALVTPASESSGPRHLERGQ